MISITKAYVHGKIVHICIDISNARSATHFFYTGFHLRVQ